MATPILAIQEVTKSFGGVTAVNNCSCNAYEKDILGIIGPNGSGKTTLFNLISSVLKPDFGEIYYQGIDITKLKPHNIARKGIGRMFQITQPFRKMTVYENMMTAKFDAEKAVQLLEFVDLIDLKDELAGNLSGGQQKLLEFARMLMIEPQLLLLDEPMAGLNPAIFRELINYLKQLHSEGATLVIVEHEVSFIMDFCNKIVVLDRGEKIAEGPPNEIKRNEKVIKAYIGE